MTAGLYLARGRMQVLLVEKMACGGQILITDRIENFPGFPKGVSGPDLAEQMLEQAKHFGLEITTAEARNIILKNGQAQHFTVMLDGGQVRAHALIIATGARWNSLGIPGEERLLGRGVSYCATCDGPLFRGKDVVVVGGGDTALEDALFLTKFANKVTVVHRRDRLRATKILQERSSANQKIEFVLNSIALEVLGEKKVEGLLVKDNVTGGEKIIKADGVFVLIGMTPNSDVARGILTLDDKGYIISDEDMKTSFDGIFACGDVRKKLLRQVVTATGEGATAAVSAQHYVESLKGVAYPAR